MTVAQGAAILAPLLLLSFVLVNAQAVTAMTSERDSRALDLLLVTDLTPKEIVFGKLGGAFYNTKEMVLLPLALCACLWFWRAISLENLALSAGWVGRAVWFVAVLGLHAGISYVSSRTAIAASLGTVFFLFVGVAAVHEDDGGLQRVVSGPVAAVSGLHARRRRGAVRRPGGGTHRRRSAWRPSFAPSPPSTRSPVSAWTTRSASFGDGRGLRLHHGGDARAGDLRV